MSRNVSNAFRAAAYAQTTNEVFTYLVTISHPNFEDDIRLCSDPAVVLPVAGVRGIVSNSEEFVYMPFEFVPPTEDDTGVSRAMLSIDNIDRRIIAAVRSANSAVNLKVEAVLTSDPDNIEYLVDNMVLRRANYDAEVVSGEISVDVFNLEPFPEGTFTPSAFPGMF